MSEGQNWSYSSDDIDDDKLEMATQANIRLALTLVAEARGESAFPRDPRQIAELLDRVRPRLDGVELSAAEPRRPWGDPPDLPGHARVRVAADDRGGLQLQSQFELTAWAITDIYTDGELVQVGGAWTQIPRDEQGRGGSQPPEFIDPSDILERGREVPFCAEMDESPDGEFRRAIAAPTQPGANVRIRYVELYSGAIRVHYLFLDPFDSNLPETLLSSEGSDPDRDQTLLSEGLLPRPPVTIADDIGTQYVWEGVMTTEDFERRGEVCFRPAPPEQATKVILTTRAGAFSVSLT